MGGNEKIEIERETAPTPFILFRDLVQEEKHEQKGFVLPNRTKCFPRQLSFSYPVLVYFLSVSLTH